MLHHLLPQKLPPEYIVRHLLLVASLVPLVRLAPSGEAFGRLRGFVAAAVGIAAVGTVFAAMAVNTRSREVMLPVLFFPVVVPVIVAAVEASGGLIRGDASADLTRWLPLMAVFDAVFLVVCPAAFSLVLEE